MPSKFHWGLDGLDEARFQAFASLLRLKNGGQLQAPSEGKLAETSRASFKALTSWLEDRPNDEELEDDNSVCACDFETFDDDRLKRQFLDRVAEIVANVKGGPHVTATLLVEWPDYAKVFVAKNHGLTESDCVFLEKLQDSMRVIANKDGPEKDQKCTSMWTDITKHYKDRIKIQVFALQQLYKDLNTANACNQVAEKRCSTSAKEQFLSLIETFRTIINTSECDQPKWVNELLLKAYEIRTTWLPEYANDLQALKSTTIPKLQTGLYLLARVRTAYNVIVKAANKFSNFSEINIIPLKPPSRLSSKRKSKGKRQSRTCSASNWRLSAVIESLGLRLDDATIKSVVGKSATVAETTRNFDEFQRQKRNVHAEIQLLMEVCRSDFPRRHAFQYLGCSKKSCLLCWNMLTHHTEFQTRGCHGKLYNKWSIPEMNGLNDRDVEVLRLGTKMTEERMRKALTRSEVKALEHVCESTVGSSSLHSMPYHFWEEILTLDKLGEYQSQARLVRNSKMALQDRTSTSLAADGGDLQTSSGEDEPLPVSRGGLQEDFAIFAQEVLTEGETHGCESCERQTDRRCSLCGRGWLCCKSCEGNSTVEHRFLCAGGSLTTADYLYVAVLEDKVPDDPQTIEDYGFDRCQTWNEKSHLLGLYVGLFHLLEGDCRKIDQWRKSKTLVANIESTFDQLPHNNRGAYFPWFLKHKERLLSRDPTPGPSLQQDLERWITEARHLLSPDDQNKQVKDLEPLAKRLGFKFLIACAQSAHPPPGKAMDEVDIWYELGFCSCKNDHEEGRLGSRYQLLLFGDKFSRDYDQSLGLTRSYLPQAPRCTFEDFWRAWQNGKLIQLFEDHDIEKNEAEFENLSAFLAWPLGSRRPSVWRLRQYLEDHMGCPTESKNVAESYGFSRNINAKQSVILREIYQRLLSRGSAMDLHHALRKGGLLTYAQKYVERIDSDVESILRACRPHRSALYTT